MAMEDGMGYNGWGIVIFLIILFAVFWGGGFGGNRGFANPYGFGDGVGPNGFGFQNYKATCDAEKAEIINTARTQYLVEQQANATQALVTAATNATNTKIDFYGYQNERDKNAELQRENMELRNQLFVKEQLAPITTQLNNIQCNMLVRPNVTGVGVACPSAAILNGLGINNLNNSNCNGVVI